MFVGLNPSTADESRDDPTIRKCIRFARGCGYGGLVMANVFAFRTTYPASLVAAARARVDVFGPENESHLRSLAESSDLVIAAWGAHAARWPVARVVEVVGPDIHYLRLTKSGHPEHPLYLPSDLAPTLWEPVC
jgi:hypothetical protein